MTDIIKKGTSIRLKTYIQMMHHLGFISLKESSQTDEELLTDIWKELGGNNENTVKAENLLVFLGAVMNTQVTEILSYHFSDQAEVLGHSRKGFMCYDDSNDAHFLSQDDILKVHNKYK